MKTNILTIFVALFLSTAMHAQKTDGTVSMPSLPNYYQSTRTMLVNNKNYVVQVSDYIVRDDIRIDIKEENSGNFVSRFRDSGEVQEWPPVISLKNNASVAKVVREIFSRDEMLFHVSKSPMWFVFNVSTDSGKIVDTHFYMDIEGGSDRSLYSISPTTIIKFMDRFEEILEFNITSDDKEYDYIPARIGIKIDKNGYVLVKKPDALKYTTFDTY